MSKKQQNRYLCRCECGGRVRYIEQFNQKFSWCDTCSPVVTITLKPKPEPR